MMKFFLRIMNKMTHNNIDDISRVLMNKEKKEESYLTYWSRPKKINSIKYFKESFSNEKIAIILQGQILCDDHFTLETVKLYSALYPKSPIIVSTWYDELKNKKKEIELIEKEKNVFMVYSDYPSVSGHGHINYQRKNTLAGIEYAEQIGCEYVLKTRTDQRLYANDTILFLKTLVDTFPLTIQAEAKGRIAVCSLSTIKNRLYNICDMLLFGYIEDLKRYFSPKEASDLPQNMVWPNEFKDPVAFARIRPGEIYFATHYIENCGFELKWTFEDSDYFRNNLFIVFDSESVDQFWPKYNRKEYMWRSYNTDKFDLASFKDWYIHQNRGENL